MTATVLMEVATMPALPDAATLVALVKRDGIGALDAYAPEVDELADTAELAKWLGVKPTTIHRERLGDRERLGGTRWPEPARMFGRTPAWTYRSIVEYRASMPGPGRRPDDAPKGKPAEPGKVAEPGKAE